MWNAVIAVSIVIAGVMMSNSVSHPVLLAVGAAMSGSYFCLLPILVRKDVNCLIRRAVAIGFAAVPLAVLQLHPGSMTAAVFTGMAAFAMPANAMMLIPSLLQPLLPEPGASPWKSCLCVCAAQGFHCLSASCLVYSVAALTAKANIAEAVWTYLVHNLTSFASSFFWVIPTALIAKLLFGAAVLGVLIGVAKLFGLESSSDEPDKRELFIRSMNWISLPIAMLAVGVGEELAFRGILMPVLGLWTSAVVFGFGHLKLEKSALMSFTSVLSPLVSGLILGGLVLYSHSLWPAIAVHALYDYILIVVAEQIRKRYVDRPVDGEQPA